MATLPNFPTKISKHQKAFWLGISLGIFVLVGFVLSQSVLAQSDGLGLNEFGNETNLGTEVNLIGLIARIINIILGFLGVVAIGLILYAGWIWMTSRGDAQKIAKAKRIMAGGVIGLAIVLSAFAIASFIIRQLLDATGGGNGGNGWGGGLPGNTERGFNVVGVDPKNNKTNVTLCRAVQAVFNYDVEPTSVSATSFSVEKYNNPPVPNDPFAGERSVSGNSVSFTHRTPPNGTFTDFEPNTRYIVTVTTAVENIPPPGQLVKNLEKQKRWSFTTGTEQDDGLPIVEQVSPTGTSGVCRNPAIQAIFDEEMLASRLNHQNIVLTDDDGNIIPLKSVSVGSDFKSFTVYPQALLASDTTFTVTLKTAENTNNPEGITDACVNPLDGDGNGTTNPWPDDNYSWTFTTGDNVNCLPELTSAVPTQGDYGEAITLTGYNLGITGEVSFNNWWADSNSFNGSNNIVSWDPTEIVVRTPVGATTGPWYFQDGHRPITGKVWVQLATEITNKLDFTVTSPYIIRTSPSSGGPGQYVTIIGWNFGDQPGEVFLGSEEVFAPQACVGVWWRDTRIIVEIPPGAASGDFQVITAGSGSNSPNKPSSFEPFTVTTDLPGPGLCSILPDNTLINTSIPVALTGDRLGDGSGSQLIFGTTQANITDWTDTGINATSPALSVADTYAVFAVVNSRTSNALPFLVDDGSGGGGSTIPEVYIYEGCSNGRQSPSPFMDSENACGNAALSARFTIAMDAGTLVIGSGRNIYVQRCNNSGPFNPIACDSDVSFGLINYIYDSQDNVRGFWAFPSSGFDRNYWYQATITTGVTSAANPPVPMANNFVWHFKVASDVCPINNVVIDPSYVTIRELSPSSGSRRNFSAAPTAFNCNSVDGSDYTWRWTTASPSDPPPKRIRLLGGIPEPFEQTGVQTPAVTVEAMDWTDNGPAKVNIEAYRENKSDSADVYVSPITCVEFDDCNLCGVGISRCVAGVCEPVFTEVQEDNGAVGNWVTIRGCYFGNAQGRVIYTSEDGSTVDGAWPDPAICGANDVWQNRQIISEVPESAATGDLTIERPTPPGGSPQTPLTFTVNNINRPGLCKVTPDSHYEADLPANITISGNGFGGQRPGDNVNYYWYDDTTGNYVYNTSATNYSRWTDKLVIATTPAVPPSRIGDNRVTINKGVLETNPYNYELIAGGGGGVGESCDLTPETLMCDDDDSCLDGLICSADDGCTCQPESILEEEPRVVTVEPTGGNICRNTIITITFDKNVTNNTIRSGEFTLSASCPTTQAPGGFKKWLSWLKKFIWSVSAQSIDPPSTCYVAGTLRASGNTITFTPNRALDPGVTYTANIISSKVDCLNSGGLCAWQFTTGPDICAIHSVEITPPSHTFTNTTDAMSFSAQARAVDGQILAASCTWAPEPFTPDDVVDYVTPPVDGYCIVSVRAKGTNGEADLKITAESYGTSGTASAPLTVFLCEVPWSSSFTDPDYDFRLTYCRGQTGDPNLLPEFSYFAVTRTPNQANGYLMKEFVFKHPDAEEIVGLRIYQNLSHLTPRQWYATRGDITQGSPTALKVDGYDALRDNQTVYIGAVARDDITFPLSSQNNDLYTNIYVLSFSQGASATTINIFNQLVDYWTSNPGLATSDQSRLQRDLVRLQDFETIKSKLVTYASSHGNRYPTLRAGTFLQYRSTSIWPSWQAELGNALSSAVPLDPINKAICPATYDQNTCWDSSPEPGQPRFYCDADSHIYQYKVGSGSWTYALSTNFEYKGVDWMGNPEINVGASNECESYEYEVEGYIQMEEDLEINNPVGGWPPLNQPLLNVFGSPTNNTVNMSWTPAAPLGTGGLENYQLWVTPDVPGFSPDPNGWGIVPGNDSIYSQYLEDISPPGDGAWWYKVVAIAEQADKGSESQPVKVIKDSTSPSVPSCNPPGGVYTAPQQIRCTTSSADVNTTESNVHYALSPVEPGCGSPIIANPTTISSSTTLNLVSCDDANNPSSIKTEEYIINATVEKATLMIQAGDSAGVPLSGVVIGLDGTEIGSAPMDVSVLMGEHEVNFADSLVCYQLTGINPTQPMTVTGDITVTGTYQATTPGAVGSPSPANASNNVSINSELGWSVTPCSASYDVYLGTSQTAVQNATRSSAEFKANITSTKYDPGILDYSQIYYWRIDAVNAAGTTKGTVWSFTTSVAPVATITFRSQDSQGAPLTGAWARLDGTFIGVTQTSTSVNHGSYTASFDDNINCYSYSASEISPSQPMNVTVDTTVTGIYNQDLPAAASNPIPNNGANNIPSATSVLNWISGGCTASFEIYFGTDQTAVQNADKNSPLYKGLSLSGSWNIDIAGLAYTTTYYWRIDAVNGAGTAKGTVWRFTTEPPPAFTLSFRSQDDAGVTINGASVTVDGVAVTGTTPNSSSITLGTHTVAFGNLSCYTTGPINPTQPMNVTGATTVTGTYNRNAPGQVTALGSTPANGGTGISINASLVWATANCADTYKVYLGPSAASLTLVNTTTSTTYKPATLNYSTTYYWRVDTENKGRTTTGAVLSFTTEPPPIVTVNFQTQDSSGADTAGVMARLDGVDIGTTPTSTTVNTGTSHNASFFDDPTDCNVLSNISPGQPMTYNANTTVTGTFISGPPPKATVVSPLVGATGLYPYQTLRWNTTNCTNYYHIYLGTSYTGVMNATLGDAYWLTTTPHPNNAVNSGPLAYGTTYYWRVDSYNSTTVQTTKGDVWWFTTVSKPKVFIDALDDMNNRIHAVPVYYSGYYIGITYNYQSFIVDVDVGSHTFGFNSVYDCYQRDSITPSQPMNVVADTSLIAKYLPTNRPIAASPSFPPNNSTNVLVSQLQTSGISFAISCGTSSFDIYFGENFLNVQNATTSSVEYVGTYTPTERPGLNFFISNLINDKDYYWRIDAKNLRGSTKGSIWSFKTAP